MRRHPATVFVTKQVRLGFSYFASNLPAEQRRMVHVASLWRSHRSEGKASRFDGIGCGVVKVGPNYPLLDIILFLVHIDILIFI
jgi:hypothetical protein